MNYENWISYRYLTASKGRFLSFLNLVSVAGVAIGVTALIVVTGVMTGFGNNLREKIIGTTPHVMIEKETGVGGFDQLRKKINTLEDVESSSAYIQGNVFLESVSGQATGIFIRGIVPETESGVTKVDQYLTKGTLKGLRDDGVIIGNELARYYGYRPGDTVTVISPGSGISGQGLGVITETRYDRNQEDPRWFVVGLKPDFPSFASPPLNRPIGQPIRV